MHTCDLRSILLFQRKIISLFIRSTGTDVHLNLCEKATLSPIRKEFLHVSFWNTLEFVFGTEIATIKTAVGGD
jgi:hypothetical protein